MSQQVTVLSRRVAIASMLFSLASIGLFLFSGRLGMWTLNVALIGLVTGLVCGIGALVIGRQSRGGRSHAPAVAVTLAVVLLIAYVGIMAYVASTLVNFANQ
jgi:hypothetical protein